VELLSDNHIKVEFYLSGKFAERLHEDSEAQLLRPFVIGERVLDISVGNSMGKVLPRGSVVTSRESVDLLTLMSGRNLSAYLAQVSQVIENLRSLAEAFTSKSRTEAMVRIFDRLDPMIKNLNTMSLDVIKLAHQATDEERLGKVLAQVQITTSEINRILPQMNSSNPNLGEQIGMLTSSVSKLSQDFKGMGSMVKDIEGDLPRAGRRIVEALDETVVVLKALQKSFILKSAAEEVREEESKRLPASPKK
jgi:phospholipid/cholesterol/gamma-HCH transport system substrate-binding protein